jgi:hypothetical protein
LAVQLGGRKEGSTRHELCQKGLKATFGPGLILAFDFPRFPAMKGKGTGVGIVEQTKGSHHA